MRPLLRSSAPRMYMKMGRCEPSTGADRSTLATAPEETGRHAAERSAGAREKAAAMGMAFPRLPALNLHLHACNSNCAPAVLACSVGKQLHTALNLAAAALPAVCADPQTACGMRAAGRCQNRTGGQVGGRAGEGVTLHRTARQSAAVMQQPKLGHTALFYPPACPRGCQTVQVV